MNIVLVQNSPYFPTHGGANKANRLMLEALAGRGHRCYAIGAATRGIGSTPGQYVSELRERRIIAEQDEENGVHFVLNGVEVFALEAGRLRSEMPRRLKALSPEWALVSSEDPMLTLLQLALDLQGCRVAYVAHTTMMLPFGPGCFCPNPRGAALLKKTCAVLTMSGYIQTYMKKWGDIDAIKIDPPFFDVPLPSHPCGFDSGRVMMINPCGLKGISIFLQLADEFPSIPFAAVPAWGTTSEDLAQMRARSNIALLPPADDINLILKEARILLVPSLWDEAFGMVAIEAMLRGIPVIASDAGGLKEAKLGVPYSLPVTPITQYTSKFDSRLIPRPVVPPQDTALWKAALHRLLTDRGHYEQLSDDSAAAAAAFAASTSITSVEKALSMDCR